MNMKGSFVLIISVLFIAISISCNSQNKVEFFVSPDGSDSNSGKIDAPFKSVEKAKNAVRSQLLLNSNKTIFVNIGGGSYYMETPIVFTSEDSGKENYPVVYKAIEGEEPVFTGSRELKDWQLLNNSDILNILTPAVRGKIHVVDLNAANIKDFGDPTEIGKRPELFCNSQLQTLARWPNDGFVNAGLAKGNTDLPETYIKKHGTVEGVFQYTNDVQDRWATEQDARMGGYWYWDWSDEFQKVKNIDTQSKIIHIEAPYHKYGYKDSLRYFGVNLLCELDSPGEWYLDRTDGLLYWYSPENIVPNQANVTLSVFNEPFMVEMKNASNITLQGLSFEEGRGSAISINEGNNCLVSDCRIERFGEDGIHIEEGARHGISGCLLRTFGCGGIKITGGDRNTLIPANHFVENTVVEYFSLFKRTYQPAIYIEGCGSRINNNRFRYSSSSAMRLEGNDFLVEYNEISHVVNESDDQGALDMWYNPSYRGNEIRYNHWSDIKGGTLHGAAAVRLDDMISGVTIFGNVFERCGAIKFGGVQIHGGKDNLVENNLFFNCLAAVSFSPWGEKRWLETLEYPVIQKKIYEDVDIRSDLYQNKYPELENIRLNADLNTIKNNLIVGSEKILLRDNKKQVNVNNTSIESDKEGVKYFYSPAVLKKYGLQSIPFEKIGPQNNKWIQ